MNTRTISATRFKAHCLTLLDEVNHGGLTITVTKRGRPVATVAGATRVRWKSTKGILARKVKFGPDIGNFDAAGLWNVVRDSDEAAVKIRGGSKR